MAFSFFGINSDGTLEHQRPKGVKGEWEDTPYEKRTRAQRVAGRTKGIASLANLVSVAGGVVSARGIYNVAEGVKRNDSRRVAIGIGQIAVGRIADIVDGKLAKKQKVRSETGAFIDSAIDKALAGYALYKLADAGVISADRALVHGVEQAGIAAVSIATQRYGGEPNPSAAGKTGAAAMWLGFGASGIETYCTLTNNNTLKPVANRVACFVDTYAVGANGFALGEYSKQLIDAHDEYASSVAH